MKQRSTQKELLDLGPDNYTQSEYAHCMKMLFRVNRIVGFFKSTVKLLKKFPKNSTVVDVGCGDGLFVLNLSRYFPEMTLKGMDISAAAILLAKEKLTKFKDPSNVSFNLLSEPKLNIPENSVDIILTTMMCHHLTNEELVNFFREALQCVRRAVIINDLHRHAIAYFGYRYLSPILFQNRLITHDGLISIQRGFLRSELKALLKNADIENYQLKWRFPFRWQLILWKS